MHDPQSSNESDAANLAATRQVHVPSSRSPGDLTVLERLEAFRDLIRHGNALLGEVVSYCREAEAAVTQLASEKSEIDRMRVELQTARITANDEAESARRAIAELETQRSELGAMREELLRARAEMEQVQRAQTDGSETLERSLREARQQQAQLEQELLRLRSQALASQSLDARLGHVDQMEAKLKVAERELATTRRALEEERSRRDRAIALIRPKQMAGEAHA